ncbi:MAG: hotdog fold thioesterase [Alphaproteobacteria bacterium]|nr:hotdog fold thioesterase [Alphaproteobacteria bacterium]
MSRIASAGERRLRQYEWQDPRQVSQGMHELPGIDYLRRFIAEGRMAPIQDTLGFTLDEVSEGSALWSLTPREWHYNPAGTVQGGVYASLLDAAMAVAIWSTLPAGVGWTTVELKINILRPMTIESGPVRCRSNLIHCSRRIGTAEGRISDAEGRLLAHGTTTCLIVRPD